MSLSIGGIVQVNINVRPTLPEVNIGCNQGLIIGTSTTITTTERVKKFNNLAEMTTAGFTSSMEEYLAAQAYFAQTPAPRAVYVGRRDTSGENPETVLAAYNACVAKLSDYYGVYICDSSDSDISTLAQKVESDGNGILFFETSNPDAVVASPEAPDIFTTLKSNDTSRAFGIYSTLNARAGAALMGAAMGKENGQANSAFSMSYVALNGVAPEPITSAQLDILLAKNGNVYATRGQDYKLLHLGRCTDGMPYDDTMYLDMTKRVIEERVMRVVAGTTTKIPQTDAGMATIIAAVSDALEYMREIGYISEGIWNGEAIGDLNPGEAIAGGYLVFAQPFALQSQADREARKAPPIFVAFKTSGTIESIVINVNVNL